MADPKKNEIRLEFLVGRQVMDEGGAAVGRIEEVRAQREGEHWVVADYEVGASALLERLAVRHLGLTWLRRSHGYRIGWEQLDLSDPDHPRLTCPVSALKKLR